VARGSRFGAAPDVVVVAAALVSGRISGRFFVD
jgi:hypothetical protein